MSRQPEPLTGYDELIAVLESLPVLLRETRRRKRLSMREAGLPLGMAARAVMRWERGDTAGLGIVGIAKVLRWASS